MLLMMLPPSSPTISEAVPDASGSAKLTFESVPEAASYKVYYGTSTDVSTSSDFFSVTDPAATSAVVTGLTNGTDYYFAMTASKAISGESSLSSVSDMVGVDSFTAATSSTTSDLKHVTYLSSSLGFYAVGKNTTVVKSTNGKDWTAVSIGCTPASTDLNDIASDGSSKIRIVGNSGTLISSNDGGSSWTCGTTTAGTVYQNRIIYANSQWWVGGSALVSGSTYIFAAHSSDGTTWNAFQSTSAKSSSSYTLNDITYDSANSLVYMVGYSGEYAYCSSNCGSASSWNLYHRGYSLKYNSIIKVDSTWYFSGISINTGGDYIESASSLTASSGTALNENKTTINRMVYKNSKIYGLSSDGIYSSTDAKTWTRRGSSDSFNAYTDIDCSSSVCVAVGASGKIAYK